MQKEMYEKGLKIRREVLGAEFVDNAIASADDFNRPLQEIVTQYCWGEIWGRPGLDRRTRSIINLAMISALNRQHEVKMHVKGALNNGLTKEEIREVFLQVAIYCGVPAGVGWPGAVGTPVGAGAGCCGCCCWVCGVGGPGGGANSACHPRMIATDSAMARMRLR